MVQKMPERDNNIPFREFFIYLGEVFKAEFLKEETSLACSGAMTLILATDLY